MSGKVVLMKINNYFLMIIPDPTTEPYLLKAFFKSKITVRSVSLKP